MSRQQVVTREGGHHSPRSDHGESHRPSSPPSPGRGGFWLLCLVDSLKSG